MEEGSGVTNDDLDEDSDAEYETAAGDYDAEDVEDIWDDIERALFLSLKYEFVTPLTSLVVSVPDEETN